MKSLSLRALLLGTGLLAGQLAVAQRDSLSRKEVERAAFRMTKATVEFLATDKQTFPDAMQLRCNECLDYAGIKEFARQNKLRKADALVDDAERRTAQLLKESNVKTMVSLEAADRLTDELNQFLQNRVTTGTGRSHRLSMPSYKAYQKEMDNIAGSIGNETPDNAVALADVATAEEGDADVAALVDEPAVQTAGPAPDGWLSMSGLALLLSVLNTGLLAYLLTRGRTKPDPVLPANTVSLQAQLDELKRQVQAAAGSAQNQPSDKAQLGKFNARLESVEGALQGLRDQVDAFSAAQPPASAPAPVPAEPTAGNFFAEPMEVGSDADADLAAPERIVATAEELQMAPRPTAEALFNPQVVFARTADLSDGFSAGSLTDAPARTMVYEVTLNSPTTATFRVLTDPDSQRLALSDPFSYLNDACDYRQQPGVHTRIQTDEPGRLALQGNKWVIDQKAQISFY